ATAEYTYTFAGWTPEVVAVTGDATYKATFTPVTRSYTVKFFDLDGETVLDTQSVAYGSAAEAPTLPEKAPDDTNHYSVTWDTAFDNITADTNVTAVATPTPHNLSAAWTWADDASTATVVITCAGCDYSETKGVTPTVKSSTDATCTQDGTITYTATYAGFTAPDKTVVGEPAHHTLGSQVPAESSTKCTETGTVAYYECTVCHLTFSDAEGQNRITDLSDGAYGPHSFTAETENDDYFNSAATCTARATYFKSCAYCGLKGEGTFESGDFDYNNHSTTETVTRNAQEPGYTYKGYTGDKYCLACDHPVSTGEEIAKLDINANETYIAATGISSEAAADPDKYDANDIATLNAKLGELEAALAIDDNDEAVNAILGELATIVAGISELEYVTVTFTVDGETVKTERILSGGSATPPAPAELIRGEENHKRFSGWSGSYTNVTENVLITATYDTEAHNWLDGEVTLRPTCMATGTQAQSCVCGATNVKILPKDSANHTGNNTTTRENEVAPTCTAAGSYEEVVTCECGVVISRTDKTVSALGHNFGAWTQTAAPTCDTAGQESKTCDRCGATETRTVAALGHSWGDWTVTRQATCTAEGTKTRTCTRDASHTETIPIPKTAHHDGNGDNKCDVCGAAIDTGFRCSFCNTYEANRDKPIIGWFYIIVHFFIHLFAQMKAWV
ncbi:MAG: hypothetical protein IKH12_03125, partial [Clostridia bacterium]|nr:hypothetical protein [Clostridia bacterium]